MDRYHRYVTSDGQCMHCNADCSQQIATAVAALNAEMDRQLTSDAHSPGTAPLTTGRGVAIATGRRPAPRLGGLSFTRSSFQGFFRGQSGR